MGNTLGLASAQVSPPTTTTGAAAQSNAAAKGRVKRSGLLLIMPHAMPRRANSASSGLMPSNRRVSWVKRCS